MYESNTVLKFAHYLFVATVFCRVKQHSLSTNFIHSLYIFKVSTMKLPRGVNLLPNESTVVMNCSFLAILAVMLKGAHALYSLPLEMVPL